MQDFDLSDILSIATGRLVADRHMDGVTAILNYMTHSDLYTHQIPRAMDACRPALARLYPHLMKDALTDDLARLDTMLAGVEKDAGGRACRAWVASLKARYGDTLPVPHLAELADDFSTPVGDLVSMVRPDQEVLIVDDSETND